VTTSGNDRQIASRWLPDSTLLNAVVAIGCDLDLRSTLRRIVEAACELLDVRYGALGVIGPVFRRTIRRCTV
jgi:hypothetical protein